MNMNIDAPVLMDNKELRKINPFIKEHFDASEKEMLEISKGTGVIRDPNLVDIVTCPVCGSDNSEQFLVKWGGRYDQCNTCSHVFLRNPFKLSILIELYKKSIADLLGREIQKNSFNARYWEVVYAKYMNHLSTKVRSDGKLIDVGCGPGRFLSFCKENYGFKLYALDIYDGLIDQLSTIVPEGNVFFVDSFEGSDIKQKFDIITLWGVLEHCRSPHNTLSKCHEYLERNGLVLLLIPNIHSRARKILGAYTPTLNPREHINFFTRQSMERVAADCGFSIHGFYQELPIIDMMWKFIDEESSVVGEIVRNHECYYHVYILKKVQ